MSDAEQFEPPAKKSRVDAAEEAFRKAEQDLVRSASENVRLSTRALFSSRKLFTSFMFFSLNMKSAEALSLIIGAKTLYFLC